MRIKSDKEVLQDIRDYADSHIGMLRGLIRGRLFAHQQRLAEGMPEFLSPVVWVLRAHLGTLDKLETLFRRDGEYSTFEMLAVTRNLFENLIWTRSFAQDAE
jgi:hypothetical protein